MLLQRLLLRQAVQCRGLALVHGLAEFASSLALIALSGHRGDVSNQGRDREEGMPPTGPTGGCLDPVHHPALPSFPPIRIEHGLAHFPSSITLAETKYRQIVNNALFGSRHESDPL